jgi:hypothetical protein
MVNVMGYARQIVDGQKRYAQVLILVKTAAGADLGIGENKAIFLNQISSGGPGGCSCPLKIVCRSNRNQP